ncbi:MAG TPA: proton-conducting transporter membrane subunit [Clostridia bacterium]|nr:proton-conducting transporter membrane subunit [Clostridia bacterium]
MIALILLPVFTALFVFLLKNKKVIRLSLLSIPVEIYLIYQLFEKVNETGFHKIIVGGWPEVVGISLYADYISFVFLFISVVAWLASSYYSLSKRADDYKFFFFLHFLRGTFYGLIFSNDLFNIFVFIEIISVISTMLIIYKKDGFSVRAGMYYLLFNSVGMFFYLAGVIIIYMRIGTVNLDYIVNLPFDATTKAAFGLIVTALGVKSAFFPVYTWTWLPRAHMAAPSGMSALLSSVLVKSGFIVLVKLYRFLPEGIFFRYLLIMGLLKAISGIMFALSQKDIKGILAFSTISQSGLILAAISGVGDLHIAGLVHLINHSLFKGLMFLTAGVIIKHYNVREVKHIRGLLKKFPELAFFLILGGLSITGFPLTNGFVSKHLIKYSLASNRVVMYALHLINIGTIIYILKLSQVLFGKAKGNINEKMKVSRLPLIFLAGITFLSGFVEMFILKNYLDIVVKVHLSDFITYFIYIAIGYLVHRYIIDRDIKVLQFLRKYQLGFRRANIVLALFLMLTMAFIY